MTQSDFYPFEPSRKSDWLKQVEKDLKGKDFDQSLLSFAWGEIRQEPFYTREDLEDPIQPMKFHLDPELPGMGARYWSNAVLIENTTNPKTNTEILDQLQNGAEALILKLEGNENWDTLFKDVLLEYISVYLLPSKNNLDPVFEFINWVKSKNFNPKQLQGAILWSPTTSLFEGETTFEKGLKLGIDLLQSLSPFPKFHAFTLDLARYANSGATGIQEVAFGLGELIELVAQLEERGIDKKTCFQNITFHSAVDSDHFPEISKLKALRNLITEVADKFQIELSQEDIHLLCSTSTWSKSFVDKNSNYIRQTYEAISAVLGGCNALWICPAEKIPGALERRIARNISTLLREESYFDKVIDPAAGSYYLDKIQSGFETEIKKRIATLEKNGGWLHSFSNRSIHTEVRKNREAIQRQVLNQEKTVVGANRFSPEGKLVNNLAFEVIQEQEFELKPTRATYLLESQKLSS
ncbi:methylmalonyl-CoA mutase family protein [Algoriphagus hitonicola]|uniref:Heterodimeric methylmalonyl-CoA mutase small subunit n=1 Tax=Algoriphagus hitonicola TaxID=435880 RepID=A0A1I2WZ70_9BACT|nr:methylmalonyl-CoA mutase family protein [Algoriphagus hitonicola]SFH06482.1 heterodimeric methylmalonyl-CoA mutase small subunit [Algoriphagus hitonicola]